MLVTGIVHRMSRQGDVICGSEVHYCSRSLCEAFTARFVVHVIISLELLLPLECVSIIVIAPQLGTENHRVGVVDRVFVALRPMMEHDLFLSLLHAEGVVA